jgi:hypothetical protein
MSPLTFGYGTPSSSCFQVTRYLRPWCDPSACPFGCAEYRKSIIQQIPAHTAIHLIWNVLESAHSHFCLASARVNQKSNYFDGNTGKAVGWLGFEDDLYIMPECHEKMHQVLDRKVFQPLIQKAGSLRLLDAKRGSNLRSGEPLPFDNLVEDSPQVDPGIEFFHIRESHIRDGVAATANDRCRGA